MASKEVTHNISFTNETTHVTYQEERVEENEHTFETAHGQGLMWAVRFFLFFKEVC